jgi:hypothetical protein
VKSALLASMYVRSLVIDVRMPIALGQELRALWRDGREGP